jgi:Ca2+-binding EF-hand superfamily protein
MTNQEKEELIKLFKSIDKNGDGKLSKDELYSGKMKLIFSLFLVI